MNGTGIALERDSEGYDHRNCIDLQTMILEKLSLSFRCHKHTHAHEFRTLFLENVNKGARGNVVVKALCYRPEGHGFYTP
jgi:hypothetical protein